MADGIGTSFLEPIALQQKMDESEAMAPLLRAREAAGTRLQTAQANDLEAMAPYTQQHKAALTRLDLARASQAETEVEGEKRAAEMMAKGLSSGGASGKMSDVLLNQAKIYAASGLPVKATAMMQAAGTMQSHEMTAENQKLTQAQHKLTQQAKLGDEFANALDPQFVYDQASWDAANIGFEMRFGQPSPYKDIPFNPEFAAGLRSQALGLKDKAMLEMHQQNLARQTKLMEDKFRHETAQEAIAVLKAQQADDREKRLAKAGGKDTGYPGDKETTAVEDMLRADPAFSKIKNLNQAAFAIASEARLLRKQSNGTLGAEEAMTRALEAKKASGELDPGKPGLILGTKPSYSPALPLPTSGKAKDLVAGKIYKNSEGVAKKWTGKGWESPPVTSTPPRSSPSDDAFGDPP